MEKCNPPNNKHCHTPCGFTQHDIRCQQHLQQQHISSSGSRCASVMCKCCICGYLNHLTHMWGNLHVKGSESKE